MITVDNITKRFHGLTAVDHLSLEIKKGEIFGLLGPNAAGKTTLIRILCGIIERDEGEVSINGMPIEKAKVDFGYVAQHFGQYEELTVWENLTFYAKMYGVDDKAWLMSLLDRYGLMPFKDKFAGTLSGGFQRRLALACALSHKPKVLFLDEPTAGIDPVTRKQLWDDFYRLSGEGKTLFITTHYMEEAQRCDQLAFISSGKIVAKGSPEGIKKSVGDIKVYILKIAYMPKVHHALHKLKGVILLNQFGNELRIMIDPKLSYESIEKTIHFITKEPPHLEEGEANLEDVFIALTQHERSLS